MTKPRKRVRPDQDIRRHIVPLTKAGARRLAQGIIESRPEDHPPAVPALVEAKRVRHRIEDIKMAKELGLDLEDLA